MSVAADDFGVQDRQSLLSKLLDAVKQCQIRFGGRTELATESDSRVVCLCAKFEAVFQHGIRRNGKGFMPLRHVTGMMKGLSLLNGDSDFVFWQLVRTVLNKHEFERYMLLRNINTDIGRGRAWLRSSLNEHSLERYMHMILSDTSQIRNFYEDWSFLMDQERNSMLPMMAAGLGSILFAISIDNADLNAFRPSLTEPTADNTKNIPVKAEFEPQPVISKSVNSGNVGKKKKKKKRPTSQVVSFDDDDLCYEQSRRLDLDSESYSAPATCVSSPVQLTGNFLAFSNSSRSLSTSNKTITSPVLDQGTPTTNTIDTSDYPNETSVLSSKFSCESLSQSFTASVAIKITNDSSFSDQLKEQSEKKFGLGLSASPVYSDTVEQCSPIATTLTPIGDTSVGELIPMVQNEDVAVSDDAVSIPSFCEDVDNAVAALAVAQRVPSWSVSSTGSQSSVRGQNSRSETLTMTSDELREALLSVLQKKDEIDENNNALRHLLEREMEMTAGLRAELEDTKKSNEEKVERLDIKIQTVSRENELLKHQLKKYIAAVQLLKHDSGKVQELTAMVGEIQPPIPEPKIFIDHQFEASEYEKKLVQVAEMHGELMEFNERLHRVLLQREAVIRRLREELIDLRGPLPDDNQTSDDDISITSDYDASSQTASSRPLINVWIPSAFLTGKTADIHHVYQVYVRIRDDEWNVYRRYAQFYALHKLLKKRDPIVNTFDFPPKKTIGKKDAKVVEQRRRRLQHYLRCVLNCLLQTNTDVSNSLDKETFITLLPFFSDQINVQKKQGRIGQSRQPESEHEQQPAQHYTGL